MPEPKIQKTPDGADLAQHTAWTTLGIKNMLLAGQVQH